ncbi:MAG: type I-U CRISPR-associated helicase/endonuclease Cas3 [Phycisphaerae bacterium]
MSGLTTDELDFSGCYEALTGYAPLRWQRRLFNRFAGGSIPAAVALPTGLGKTSVIPIWLIALASGAGPDGGSALPRRLAYIVNRRTVVDQATDQAKRLLGCIYLSGQRAGLAWATEEAIAALGLTGESTFADERAGMVAALRTALARLSGDDAAAPLAVSTLRGELADNGEWKINPARPAVIIGTIDMIGSKLLFSGYGDGRYGRAHHAGLIGQDALVVHDEAHLSPAFDELLRSVAAEQARCCESRPIRVMSLSATTRGGGTGSSGGTDGGSPFGIEDEDRRDTVACQRLNARKTLTIVDADKGKVSDKIAEEALRLDGSSARVLIYVCSPEVVAQVAKAVVKKLGDGGGTRVARLTGTIRGKERDELAESEVFRVFKAGADRSAPLPHALYLVSTSAGEVGADLDADHLVCDLTTLDSMAQRFGRVNRLGGDEDGNPRAARITVVIEKPKESKKAAQPAESTSAGTEGDKKDKKQSPFDAAIAETGTILRRIADDDGDVSPAALAKVIAKVIDGLSAKEMRAAFSPLPTILPATDVLFDAWSLTSIAGEQPGRPEVAPYLHGVADWQPPETHVAWRADVALLARAGGVGDDGEPVPCSRDDLEEVFDAFPLRSVETLRDRTERVQEQLQALAERLRQNGASADVSQAPGEEAETRIESEIASDRQDESRPVPSVTLPADPWVVLMRGSAVRWARLSELAPQDNQKKQEASRLLAFGTVVLPVEAGGLKDGMLVGEEPAPKNARSLDVAEAARDGAGTRQRVMILNGAARPLLGGEAIAGVGHATIALAPDGDDDAEPPVIEYRLAKGPEREPGERVPLDKHNEAVSEAARRIGTALGLDGLLVEALRLAGKWHDMGKRRVLWQRYADNENGAGPIAKSERYRHGRMLGGYRHEFGSLLDAAADTEITNHAERDLILHLLAAHHGWARPHFEPHHFDLGDPGKPVPTAQNEALAVEVMQRFGRLQQRFGRWGLAWLESLLRCADAQASRQTAVLYSAGDAAAAASLERGER